MSLDRANVIDAMGLDESSGRVLLVIHHAGPWDGSDQQLFLLQEKLNAYLSFALDGEMAEAYPDLAGHPIGLRIDSTSPPDPRTLHLLGHVREQIGFQDITLDLAPAPASGCGTGCGCH